MGGHVAYPRSTAVSFPRRRVPAQQFESSHLSVYGSVVERPQTRSDPISRLALSARAAPVPSGDHPRGLQRSSYSACPHSGGPRVGGNAHPARTRLLLTQPLRIRVQPKFSAARRLHRVHEPATKSHDAHLWRPGYPNDEPERLAANQRARKSGFDRLLGPRPGSL